MYASELWRVGGFDTTIQGWGKEDVKLYSSFVSYNVSIFRAVDPGLVHVYHPIYCDKLLEKTQYDMCLGSKAATYGCRRHLAAIVYNTPKLFYSEDELFSHEKEREAKQKLIQTKDETAKVKQMVIPGAKIRGAIVESQIADER